MPESEIMKQLKTLNGVEVVPIPPYPAQLLGLYRDAPHMLQLKVAQLVGAVVITTNEWNKLSEAERKVLTDAAKAIQTRLEREVPRKDDASVAFEERLRCDIGNDGGYVPLLRFNSIERNGNSSPATFQRLLAVPLIGKEMFDRSQQERTEPATVAVGIFEVVLLDQPGEKLLCQVLGFVRIVTVSANERVHRMPVRLA